METKKINVMSIEQEMVMRDLIANGIDLSSSKKFSLNASSENLKLINNEFKELSNLYLKSDNINFEKTNEYKEKESITLNKVKLIINKVNYKHALKNIQTSTITDSMKNTIVSFDKAARDAVKIGKRDIAKTIINGIFAVDRSINNVKTDIKNNYKNITINKDDAILLNEAMKAKTDLARSMSRIKERSNSRGMSL